MSRPESRGGGRKAEIEQLRADNTELRRKLDLVIDPDPSATFLALAQDVRDQLAVRVLWMHCGDLYAGLRHLGFDTAEKSIGELRAMAVAVFDTPGVRERMTADLTNAESQKEALIARQVQIALHGTDENSSRAFAMVARTLGWEKNPQPPRGFNAGTVNIWQMFGDRERANREQLDVTPDAPALPQGPLALLAHDPGEPIKVDTSEDLGFAADDE